MRLNQKGELQLLKDIKKRFNIGLKTKGSGIILGIGDDAAVFSCPDGKILVTTDMMTEKVHFDLEYTSASHLAFKLVSVNVSDIYAMGGKPRFVFLNTAFKGNTSEEFFWDFFSGISVANSIYGLKLLGGDISSAKNDVSVSATLIGEGKKIIKRSGAKKGDRIYITNTLGDSACGLHILNMLSNRGKRLIRKYGFGIIKKDKTYHKWLFLNNVNSKNLKLDFDTAKPLIMRHLVPVVSYSEKINEIATSMIDVSDGLFIDLIRICDESGVGARVYLDKIPLSGSLKSACNILNLNPYRLATSGGEDYELLFTASPNVIPQESNISCIGEIIPNERIVLGVDGKESPLLAEGFQHFGS